MCLFQAEYVPIAGIWRRFPGNLVDLQLQVPENEELIVYGTFTALGQAHSRLSPRGDQVLITVGSLPCKDG